MKRLLVAGATGYLGRWMVQRAKERGWWVRALVRPGKHVPATDDQFEADATDAATLKGACDDVDVVFSSLGITRQKDGVTYDAVDYGANHHVLAEAERAGVKRFGFVSVVGPELFTDNPMVSARERFVTELKRSEIPHALIRATGFFSDMGEVFEMARRGSVYLFDDGAHRMNPVHGSDLADACLDAIEGSQAEIEVGGPDVLTYRQMAELAFDALGKPTKVRTVPSWLTTAALAVVRPLNPQLHTVGTFMRTALTHDVVGQPCGTHHLADHYATLAREPQTDA